MSPLRANRHEERPDEAYEYDDDGDACRMPMCVKLERLLLCPWRAEVYILYMMVATSSI